MLRFRLALTDPRAFIICFALLFCFPVVKLQTSSAAIEPTHALQAPVLPWAGQQAHKAASPEEVTQQFYNWYLHAKFPTPKRSNMATFRKYVTQGFMKRATAPDVESVLFIDAQDDDETWADNFTVGKATISGQSATVPVALNGKEMKYNLRVTLRQEGGLWKIDNVKGSEN